MGAVRRLRDSVSDAWFGFRIWLRYDMFWSSRAWSLLAAALVVSVVGAVVSVSPVPSPPAALPTSPTSPTSPSSSIPPQFRAPVEVFVVGDSLVAGEEGVYAEQLRAAGFVPAFDAAVSRGLRSGWFCPGPVRPADEVLDESAAEGARDVLSGDVDGAAHDAGYRADEGAAGVRGVVSGDDDPDGMRGGSGGDAAAPSPGEVPGSSGSRCRRQGLGVLADLFARGELPDLVVVALGTNDASLSETGVRAGLGEARSLLGGRRLVLLETASEPMSYAHEEWNRTARSWCARDRDCRFVDWVGAGTGLFADDGVHLNATGSLRRAAALAAALSGLVYGSPSSTPAGFTGVSRR